MNWYIITLVNGDTVKVCAENEHKAATTAAMCGYRTIGCTVKPCTPPKVLATQADQG
jgi:hypothetical protein